MPYIKKAFCVILSGNLYITHVHKETENEGPCDEMHSKLNMAFKEFRTVYKTLLGFGEKGACYAYGVTSEKRRTFLFRRKRSLPG